MDELPALRKSLTRYRVIYGDTDQMGVVYYANYLRWFECGRSEFLREIGVPYTTVEQRGLHFPVVQVTCRYMQSARYDDVVQIETALAEFGRATLKFVYRITRESDGVLLARGETEHACIDGSGRISRIPKILMDVLDARAN